MWPSGTRARLWVCRLSSPGWRSGADGLDHRHRRAGRDDRDTPEPGGREERVELGNGALTSNHWIARCSQTGTVGSGAGRAEKTSSRLKPRRSAKPPLQTQRAYQFLAGLGGRPATATSTPHTHRKEHP